MPVLTCWELEAIKVQRRQYQKKRRCDKDHLALHPVTVKIKAICTNILPCQKAKSAKDDQGRDHCGKQWISCIPCQRNKFCHLCSQQVKAGIAERRNGMKQCIPDPAQTIIGAKFVSLTRYAGDPLLTTVIAALIVFGGLGFLTWEDICTYRLDFHRYRMQSKVILVTTAFLLVLPSLYFYCFEFTAGSARQRILLSMFQSVTPRTAVLTPPILLRWAALHRH